MTARTTGWLLVVLGVIGLFGSAALAIEKYLKLADPNHVPSCSLNALLDCGDAMDSWQGSLLGFPNPLIGIAAFPVVITTGAVVLLGARLPRWYWLTLLGGTTLGMGLIVFLIWTTMYAISAMCPYCMVVWVAMLPLFWYQVVHAAQQGYLPAGDAVRRGVLGRVPALLRSRGAALCLVRGLRRRARLARGDRAHDDGRAVGAHLGERRRDLARVEAHADHGVRAAALRLLHHAVHDLLARLVDELRVLLHLAAADRAERRDEVRPDVRAAHGHAHDLPEHRVDAVAGHLVRRHDDHGAHPRTGPDGRRRG